MPLRSELQDAFAAHGTVMETNVMMDRMTNRPRGFGFVTMSTPEEAQKAINALTIGTARRVCRARHRHGNQRDDGSHDQSPPWLWFRDHEHAGRSPEGDQCPYDRNCKTRLPRTAPSWKPT